MNKEPMTVRGHELLQQAVVQPIEGQQDRLGRRSLLSLRRLWGWSRGARRRGAETANHGASEERGREQSRQEWAHGRFFRAHRWWLRSVRGRCRG